MATTVNNSDDSKSIEPFEEQEPFLWDSHQFYNFAAGVGSGKTAIGVIRNAVNAEVWNPGYMGAIVAPTTQMIKNAIVPKMQEFGIYDRWEYYGPSAELPGFHTPQGSRVVVLSADNERHVERAAGLDLAWWHIDEARDVPERMYEILQQRLRVGNYRNGYTTSTPRKNHYEEWCFKNVPETPEPYGQADIYNGKDRLTITGVTPDCNPHVPNNYESDLMADLPDGIAAQEVQGRFVDVGGGVFTRGMLTFTHKNDVSTDLSMKTIIAVDPAATVDAQRAEAQDSDYWACAVVQAVPSQDVIYVTETVRKRGMSLARGCEWIASIANQAKGAHVVAEANQAQRWLIEELKDYGVYADPVTSTRNKESRILDLSIPLENGTIEFVDWNAETQEDVGKEHPYQELVGELLSFPESTHDDLIDALHRAVDFAPVSLGTNILGADPYGNTDDE